MLESSAFVYLRFLGGKFSQSYKVTIGADFSQKEVIVDGKAVVLEVAFHQHRFGIQLARKDSDLWVLPFTEDVMHASLFMTLLKAE